MEIIECSIEHAEASAVLFNQYRIFYELPDDLAAAQEFISANLTHARSRIFLVLDDEKKPVAFAQLYPAMCSIAMKPFYWLYDLFVAPSARNKGYARHLMTHLTSLLSAEGAQRISLDTAHSNKAAQALYESLGYTRESEFMTYHKVLAS
ncbi:MULTISPECIES: GNAT family N-acetyltransferase [unclassified Pseudomonas]|uniref:GNAT family N-acetyltransferase n=1 Tax=unclassified Pseudomonas TaxID=196821 RepID=UPI0015A3F60B|nr:MULTISPECIES: GNAT family N-acetyltransferase [unclassified Pseudomonas]NWC96305.1 GNAT family N-acetyltransferase [Pseudomonas sp. IPO3779]NWD21258.1 GNAT family N-acetyltransferase [Pseudomonas sp. IPO3778]